LMLMCTAWLILAGAQVVRNTGDFARFGATVFQILAPLQLAVCLFFSAMQAAIGVSQEKDRRTFTLLLLTRMSNSELVLGKLLASLLLVFSLLAAGAPLFMLATLLGGVSFDQVGQTLAVTLVSSLAAGSLGSLVALWREKTFQALGLTLLGLVVWLAIGETVARGVLGDAWRGAPASQWAVAISPWQAVLATARPMLAEGKLPLIGSAVSLFLVVAGLMAVAFNAVAVWRVRVWTASPEPPLKADEEAAPASIWGAEYDLERAESGETRAPWRAAPAARASTPGPQAADQASQRAEALLRRSAHAAPGRVRPVWDNPVLWREVATWAYGRRVLAIRFVYLGLVGLAAAALVAMQQNPAGVTFGGGSLIFAPLCVLSLVLINAQAVTALTSERDVKALDLLLVTDLTAKEFVFGKLAGALYNTKEMALAPLALAGYLWFAGALSTENAVCLAIGLVVMIGFVAMLGVHAGMSYDTSRGAIGASLGTLFFLLIGVATCIRMMIAFSGSFHYQLPPFLAFMVGGGVGLYIALGARNPSSAIALASAICPFCTFMAISSFWQQKTLLAFWLTVGAYGFATLAILIPAVYEFEVATGRASAGGE